VTITATKINYSLPLFIIFFILFYYKMVMEVLL